MLASSESKLRSQPAKNLRTFILTSPRQWKSYEGGSTRIIVGSKAMKGGSTCRCLVIARSLSSSGMFQYLERTWGLSLMCSITIRSLEDTWGAKKVWSLNSFSTCNQQHTLTFWMKTLLLSPGELQACHFWFQKGRHHSTAQSSWSIKCTTLALRTMT